MIYEYCLIVQGEIVPFPAYYEYPLMRTNKPTKQQRNYMHRKPDVALLQVSKQISAETCPILYGRNRWRMGRGWVMKKDHLIKDVIVSLDFRDYDPEMLAEDLEDPDLFPEEPRLQDSDEDVDGRHEHIHGLRVNWLTENLWYDKVSCAEKMTLRSITIDISKCWCFSNCCRLFDRAECMDFFTNFKNTMVTIEGIHSKKELKRIRGEFKTELPVRLEDDRTYTLVVDKPAKARP
ncbi:MAG: hypothetical protein Q9209_003557 [Squamulea sp. 1 TL-2023]